MLSSIDHAFSSLSSVQELSCLADVVLGAQALPGASSLYHSDAVLDYTGCYSNSSKFAPAWHEALLAEQFVGAEAGSLSLPDRNSNATLVDFADFNSVRAPLWTTLAVVFSSYAIWFAADHARRAGEKKGQGQDKVDLHPAWWTVVLVEVLVFLQYLGARNDTAFVSVADKLIFATTTLFSTFLYFPLRTYITAPVSVFYVVYTPVVLLAISNLEPGDTHWAFNLLAPQFVGVVAAIAVTYIASKVKSSMTCCCSGKRSGVSTSVTGRCCTASNVFVLILSTAAIAGAVIFHILCHSAETPSDTICHASVGEDRRVALATTAVLVVVFWLATSNTKSHWVDWTLAACGFVVGAYGVAAITANSGLAYVAFDRANPTVLLYLMAYLCLLQWASLRLRSASLFLLLLDGRRTQEDVVDRHAKEERVMTFALTTVLSVLLLLDAVQLQSVWHLIGALVLNQSDNIRRVVVMAEQQQRGAASERVEGGDHSLVNAIMAALLALVFTLALTFTSTGREEVKRALFLPLAQPRGRDTLLFVGVAVGLATVLLLGVWTIFQIARDDEEGVAPKHRVATARGSAKEMMAEHQKEMHSPNARVNRMF
jgi:hypothetical protein